MGRPHHPIICPPRRRRLSFTHVCIVPDGRSRALFLRNGSFVAYEPCRDPVLLSPHSPPMLCHAVLCHAMPYATQSHMTSYTHSSHMHMAYDIWTSECESSRSSNSSRRSSNSSSSSGILGGQSARNFFFVFFCLYGPLGYFTRPWGAPWASRGPLTKKKTTKTPTPRAF